jgi:hypothetical protein
MPDGEKSSKHKIRAKFPELLVSVTHTASRRASIWNAPWTLDVECWMLSVSPKLHLPFVIRHSSFKIVAFCLLLALTLPASAHLPLIASANATIETNGAYSVDLTFDLPP